MCIRDRIFTELEAVAKVQSSKSSNAIEGIVTSDERIAAIVNQNSAPLNHNEAEIAGYRDVYKRQNLNRIISVWLKTTGDASAVTAEVDITSTVSVVIS